MGCIPTTWTQRWFLGRFGSPTVFLLVWNQNPSEFASSSWFDLIRLRFSSGGSQFYAGTLGLSHRGLLDSLGTFSEEWFTSFSHQVR